MISKGGRVCPPFLICQNNISQTYRIIFIINKTGDLMSNVKITSSLVSVQWLAEHLDSENIVILDASMKPVTLSATDSFEEDTTCIKGA